MIGLGVSQGIGIGTAFVIEKKSININRIIVDDTDLEKERLRKALCICKKQLEELYIMTTKKIGEKEAQIFKSHELMIEDETFISEVEAKISIEKVNAEFALNEVSNIYIKMFENIKDEYLRERAQDVRDVMTRILKILLGVKKIDYSKMKENSIVVAKDLTSSDTAEFDRTKIVGMITEVGGNTSHVAIMARIMGIPTIVGIEGVLDKIEDDSLILCDGETGEVITNPTKKQINLFKKKKEYENKIKDELKKQINLPTITRDGFKVELSSNIGTPNDVSMVLQNDGEGIGLLRSEFIFMNRKCQPTENEQFEEYKEVLVEMGDKPVVIRTLDIGGDKELPYFDIPKEMNPFLGYRAIRLCLGNLDIFKTQLRAILRASMYGNAKIMFPMISTMKELRDAKSLLEESKNELRAEGILFKENIEVGIMIEIPSAAIISDLLAKEVDFFSIGTNDLIQYTMAVDRMNSKLSHLYSQYHPALLRLIKNVIKNGHDAGIWVGMCGEAAGDSKLIPVFIGMGLDEFSMNASSILRSRYIIRNLNKKDMEQIAENTLYMDTAIDVEEYLSSLFLEENESQLGVHMKRSN
jgi:phosphotransferase system enzyme I (PtsI)